MAVLVKGFEYSVMKRCTHGPPQRNLGEVVQICPKLGLDAYQDAGTISSLLACIEKDGVIVRDGGCCPIRCPTWSEPLMALDVRCLLSMAPCLMPETSGGAHQKANETGAEAKLSAGC